MPESRSLKSGDVLFVQGGMPERIYLMGEGEIEILSSPREYLGLDDEIIIDKSVRVCTLKGKVMLMGFSDLLTSPYTKSIRAISPCKIVEYPLSPEGFTGIAERDVPGSINMLRQLFNLFMQSQNQLKKAAALYTRMCQVDDNLMILYHQLSSNNGPERMNTNSETLYEAFSAGKGVMPQQAGIDFLVEDKGKILKKNYSSKLIYDVIGQEYLDIVKGLLKANPQILVHLFKGDINMSVSMFSVITGCFNAVLENIHDIIDKINLKNDEFFNGEGSWSAYLAGKGGLQDWSLSNRIQPDFSPNLKKLFEKIDEIYTDLCGKTLREKNGFSDLITAAAGVSAPVSSTAEETQRGDYLQQDSAPVTAASVISTGLQKSIYQIFEFSMIEKEFQNKMLKLLNDFKTMKSPLNPEPEGRKVRRFISQMYWDLYKQVYVRTKTESSVPKAVRLMLNFGFLDDEMLEPFQVVELNDLARIREKSSEIPILTEYEFLSRIYAGDEEPSITEMGLSYEAFLKEQDKYQKKDKNANKRGGDSDPNEENLNKTLHEIEQRLASTAAVCSGGTATAFPILTSEIMKGSFKGIYQSKSSIASVVKNIRDIDFSLFYRETVLKLDSAREIIKEEILPYIIILPIYGTKTLLWQEMTGNNKRSRGRIVVPAFFMGDIEKSLMHTFACYRWELSRSIKGAMWADPIEGGITGEYFDYVNTYKKNTKLSQEAKEKIALRFKSLRTNRDRFADDYVMWVAYEKEGIMKLNTVVREMFFKHIPFNMDIREQLEGMPAFSKYANRYKNVSVRDIAAYERKFKKYQDASGNYPPEIAKFFEFMKK